LNESTNKSQDSQFILEKYYLFAMDYVSSPQVHITWISKLANIHRLKCQYLEAGMCEIYLILYIHRLLPKGTTTIDIEPINKEFGQFFLDENLVLNPQFTSRLNEKMLVQHITSACNDFEKGRVPWYGLTLSSVIIPFYISMNRFNELSEIHNYIKPHFYN